MSLNAGHLIGIAVAHGRHMQQVTEAQTKQQKESADERFLAGLMLEHKDLSDEQLLSALDRAKDLRISADREAELDAQVEAARYGPAPVPTGMPVGDFFICVFMIGFIVWLWCVITDAPRY